MMTSKLENIISCLFIYIISIFFFFSSSNFSYDSAVFPKVIASILAVLNTILLFQTFIKREKVKQKEGKKNFLPKKTIFTLIFTMVYVLLINIGGFILLTPIYIFIISSELGYRNKTISIIIALATTFTIYLVFKVVLGVPVPSGFLFS